MLLSVVLVGNRKISTVREEAKKTVKKSLLTIVRKCVRRIEVDFGFVGAD